MAQSMFILLLIVFSLYTVSAKSINTGGYVLKHLGRYRWTSRSNDESSYFMSTVPTTWLKAVDKCDRLFGANLIAIETVEEWHFLKIQLASYDGSVFWTSGTSKESTFWIWSATNKRLPPFAPWDIGYPKSNTNDLQRVSIVYNNTNAAFWRTAAYTEMYSYICEVNYNYWGSTLIPDIRDNKAINCLETNDLVIVLDSSGSIGPMEYLKAKIFVKQLAAAFTVHSPSRLSFILMAGTVEVLIDLKNKYSRRKIRSVIEEALYMKGGTSIWLAIDEAVAQFNSSPRNVTLNMVLLTDGYSNNRSLTIAAAERATAQGIRTFVVGIEDFNLKEIGMIVGGRTDRIFSTYNIDELMNLLPSVIRKVCENI